VTAAPGRNSARFLQHEDRVLLLIDGNLIADMPWDKMLEFCAAGQVVAKKAEEWAKATRLVADSALLIRTGAPFGLTNHPLILGEAVKEAVTNRDLRRYLRGGVKSQEVFGTPTVVGHEPRSET